MSQIRVDIFKDLSKRKLFIRAVKYEGNKSFVLNSGNWIEFSPYEEIKPTLELPYDTEIETDRSIMDYSSLLEQKDKDKNDHIKNLNNILNSIISIRR